jgi:tetratricopeptide (TPR) repeat protein
MARNDRLRQHRIARNWRQQDVADQLGIAVLTIQRWERGSQQPSAYYRVKLCALFGISAQELGLIEELQPLMESEPLDEGAAHLDEIQLWTVPYARNPHFTGREELLQLLEQHFSPQPAEQAATMHQVALTQAQAIKGLGGIGKTQTAVEYAYRSREQGLYNHTLWINAASEEAILNSFAALADFLPSRSICALHIREQQFGSDHPLITSPLNNLGLLYHRLGKYEQTEALFLRALHIREQHLAPDHPDMANSFTILGLLYVRQGKYDQAKQLFLRALHIREQQLGPDHPDLVYTLINLANLYCEQGQFEPAEPLYLRALHIAEQQGSEHLLVAYPLTGLIDLYCEQGQFEQAEKAGLRAARIREQQLGLEHSQLAYTLHGLANLYYKLGKYEHAELLYLRTLHIREQQLGRDHLEVADVLYDLADFQHARGNTSEAISLYQRTLTIREQIIGAGYPLTRRTRERLHTITEKGTR